MNNVQRNHTAFDLTGRIYSLISIGLIVCVIAFIFIVLIRYGWDVLSLRFITTEPDPSALHAASGGILTPVIGTFLLTIMGIVISFPFSLATAIYLCFYTKKGIFKNLVKSAVDILAGVPTIVIALFALVVFTLPQMGLLSAVVDTRSNSLDGAVFVYMYGDEFIDVFFDFGHETNMTAEQYAETVSETLREAISFANITSNEVFVEANGGAVAIAVGGEHPLELLVSTKEDAAAALGMAVGDTIYPGTHREYVVNESNLTGGTVRAYGRSFFVAGITMAVMILPFVIKSMEEAIKAVPASYIDAAYALGASKWRTISKVVLRAAGDGLVTGVILGMGRIIGDTAIVWLTLGGSIRMTGNQPWFSPENWLSTLQNVGGTLTTYIYYSSPAGEGNQYDVAFGAAIVLIAIIVLLNILAAIIGKMGMRRHA